MHTAAPLIRPQILLDHLFDEMEGAFPLGALLVASGDFAGTGFLLSSLDDPITIPGSPL